MYTGTGHSDETWLTGSLWQEFAQLCTAISSTLPFCWRFYSAMPSLACPWCLPLPAPLVSSSICGTTPQGYITLSAYRRNIGCLPHPSAALWGVHGSSSKLQARIGHDQERPFGQSIATIIENSEVCARIGRIGHDQGKALVCQLVHGKSKVK